MKCHEKVNEEQRKKIFQAFYSLSRDGQAQYISETVKRKVIKKERIRKSTEKSAGVSRRKFTRKYFLTNQDGQSTEVCKICIFIRLM